MLYVYKIVTHLSIYGPGTRTVIWFSGCSIRCKHCINPELWERDPSLAMSATDVLSKIEDDGVTLLGGEPLDQEDLLTLIKLLKKNNKSIILFTGYSYQDFDSKMKKITSKCDIVISEPYIEELKDDSLYLRGSLNQIIHFNSNRYNEHNFAKNNSYEICANNDNLTICGRNKSLINDLLDL